MSLILLSPEALKKRCNKMHRMFAPLRKNGERTASQFAVNAPPGAVAIVVSDSPVEQARYRDEVFRTSRFPLRCKYFEIWSAAPSGDLKLQQAYFTLLKVVSAEEPFKELLCIHSDPCETSHLKRGPHLHVSCANEPIADCHFPLEQLALNQVLKDCDTLSEAITRAITVVADDLLHRYPA